MYMKGGFKGAPKGGRQKCGDNTGNGKGDKGKGKGKGKCDDWRKQAMATGACFKC